MKSKLFLLILLIPLCVGCSGPQKLYEKGNYKKAYDKALSELKKSKNRKMKTLLNKSFSKMIDDARGDIIDLDERYEYTALVANLEIYEEVRDRYNKGQQFLDEDNILKFDNFQERGELFVMDAYEVGLNYMREYEETKLKVYAQDAFQYFSLVDTYGLDEYQNLESLIQNSLELGIVIYNIHLDLSFDRSYSWELDHQFDDLEGKSGFIQIVYDRPISNEDCLVELDFSQLEERYDERSSSRTYSQKIQDGYTIQVDTSGNETKVPKYITVEGTVITNRITKALSWIVDLEVRSVTQNCNLKEERFYEGIEDVIEKYEIRGDERAIPSEYFNTTNSEFENTPRMVDDLIDELYREVRNYLY